MDFYGGGAMKIKHGEIF